jgi:hypothetical protein
MDDVNVNELSGQGPITAYNKFFNGKIYGYKNVNGLPFIVSFRVRTITLAYGGGYRVWCDILSLNYDSKNKINTSKMNLLVSYIKRELKSDLNLCSINNEDVVISNRRDFEYEPNPKLMIGGGYSIFEKSVKYSIISPNESKFDGYDIITNRLR